MNEVMSRHTYPFVRNELLGDRLLDRLRRRPNPRNAIVELTNLLAAGVKEVTVEDRQALESRYSVDFSRDFLPEREKILRDYLNYCLSDLDLSTDERDALNSLVEILSLPDESVLKVRRSAFEEAYSAALRERISDRRLNPDELAELEQLRQRLDISEERAHELRSQEGNAALRAYLNQAVEDGLVTPEEDAEAELTLKSLNIEHDLSDEEIERWRRYRLYWELQYGQLPIIDPGLNLQRSEICHFVRPVDWYELRTETQRVNYGGPTARIRLAKGIYWSAGSLGVQRVSREVLRHIDSGQLYLTNKRIIFLGQKRNTNIRLNRILDFTPYTDGVGITKDAGRNPVFSFTDDIDVFCLALNRLLEG